MVELLTKLKNMLLCRHRTRYRKRTEKWTEIDGVKVKRYTDTEYCANCGKLIKTVEHWG